MLSLLNGRWSSLTRKGTRERTMSDNFNKKRIVKNSLMLYVRMLFTMWLNLWATRLVLANLGVEDYGIYGVVGSVVAMFALLSSGLTLATNRFLSYEMGREGGDLRLVFSSCVNIAVGIAFVTLLLLEFVGVWFLNHKLQIPPARLEEATWVFHLSVFSTLINILSIPYNAMIIAKEKMGTFAYISIIQVALNFLSVYVLAYIPEHRLFWYAFFLILVSLIFRAVNQIYCRVKFAESKYYWSFSPETLKSIGRFMGANMIDSIVVILHGQGITFVFNMAYGVAINAVYSVSMQVKTSVLSFSQNIQKAIEPQIIKNYASGDNYHFRLLVNKGSLFQAILSLTLLIPLILRTQQILELWLGKVPEHLCQFVQITIFLSLIYAVTCPVITGAFATGRIKRFLFVCDGVYLVGLVCYYLCSRNGFSAEQTMLLLVLFEVLIAAYRIYRLAQISQFSVREFTLSVLMPCAVTGVLAYAAMWYVNPYIPYTLLGLIAFLCVSTALLFALAFFICFRPSERKQAVAAISKFIKKRK